MINKTRGIVLNHTRYRESSAIVHIFTLEYGMQSYMVNGAYGKRKKGNMILLQPLNLLELEVYHHPDKEIQRIKEFKLQQPLHRIPLLQTRRAQAFLLTEVLSRVLRNEGKNLPLFSFIQSSIAFLDSDHPGMENFHIYFLFHLTRHLGFYPTHNYSNDCCFFDIMEGCFISGEPAHPHYLKQDNSKLFSNLFIASEETLPLIAANVAQRRALLEALILFFELHHQGVGKIRSIAILESLFAV